MEEYITIIIYANMIPFMSMISFLFLLMFNTVFDRRQTRLFLVSSVIILVMLVMVSLDFLFEAQTDPNVYLLRRITSFCNFAFPPAVPFLLYRITKDSRPHFTHYILVAINFILCAYSIFSGIVFHISPDNKYGRGALFFFPFLCSLFYMGMLFVQRSHQYTKNKQIERACLVFVTLLLCVGMYLEIMQRFYFLTWGFASLALIMYYLFLNIQSAILDPLTSLYNRKMYDRQLSVIDRKSTREIALLDINDFKKINDLQGHDAGDRCLISMAEALSQSFSGIGTVFRIGGDEFVVISKKQDANGFAAAIGATRQKMAQKDVSFACGMLTYHPPQSIQEAFVEADRLMYQDKNQK